MFENNVSTNQRSVKVQHSRADHEFLPAALEILEKPASPVRIAFLWFICILATVALLWTWFGTFDIVATAQGKVQPAGRVKIVQSLETGKTKSVPVMNGMQVKSGDMLIELDDTEIRAEEIAAIAGLNAFKAEVARREAVLSVISDWQKHNIWITSRTLPVLSFPLSSDIPDYINKREQKIYQADLSQLSSSLNNLNAQRIQKQAEIESLANAVTAQKALVATLAERVTMRSSLAQSKTGSRAHVIDALQQQQEATTTLTTQMGQLNAARAALNATTSEAAKFIDSFVADNAARQSEAARRIDELEQQVVKAEKRRKSMIIRSPIDGTVQASAVNTTGQVVTTGTELMRIVPKNSPLEIEAYLPNRDIGFVKAGQEAVIKVEAFPFTRFGIIKGEVFRIATDAIPEPDAQQLEGSATKELNSLIPTGNAQRMQNLVFPITVTPGQKTAGQIINLDPGMTVTVEVNIGKRRILEYLFSPLLEITSQAMREF
ncbi:HlyD family type I secretion periplasmic adaptor subunit [Pseudochrobactrum asaccharolyticum]|uniref:HlyD family type I secretion periplasmic adaptor subunit n=1 Tax=Pseudochrobactrum asaccharolyticum TaxID=354351 RepID=UPI004042F0E7